MKKLIIYPADIISIVGKSDRYCRNLIAKIKAANNKQKHQPVTTEEFCKYMAIQESELEKHLK